MKIYALYRQDNSKLIAVSTIKGSFDKQHKPLVKIYKNLTKKQVSVLSYTQATFFELLIEQETNNA